LKGRRTVVSVRAYYVGADVGVVGLYVGGSEGLGVVGAEEGSSEGLVVGEYSGTSVGG